MDISGEIANIHKRTDAKNLVTTATTIHLHEQKKTNHMISMLRKKACSGSVHDFPHIPTQKIAWQIASQRLQAKADILNSREDKQITGC